MTYRAATYSRARRRCRLAVERRESSLASTKEPAVLEIRRLAAFAYLPVVLVACGGTAAAPPSQTTSASVDTALSQEKAAAALAGIAESGADCRVIALVAQPIAAPHLEDPNIQQ